MTDLHLDLDPESFDVGSIPLSMDVGAYSKRLGTTSPSDYFQLKNNYLLLILQLTVLATTSLSNEHPL